MLAIARSGFAALCLVGCLVAAPALAAECDTENHAEAIIGCTAYINAGRGTPTDRAQAFRRRGFAYLDQREFEKALSDFTQATKLQPGVADDYYGRGVAYAELNQSNLAMIELAKAIAVNKNHADAYYERGRIRDREGRYADALQEYGDAIRSRPDFAEALSARAWTYYKMRLPAKGLNDIDKAIAAEPNDGDYHHVRAYILEAMGQKKAAIEQYMRILRADPGNINAEAGLVRLGGTPPPPGATGKPKRLPSKK